MQTIKNNRNKMILRFLVFANIVAKLSTGEDFDAVLSEQSDMGFFEQGDIELTEAQRRIINNGWRCRSNYECRMKNPNKPNCDYYGICRRGLSYM